MKSSILIRCKKLITKIPVRLSKIGVLKVRNSGHKDPEKETPKFKLANLLHRSATSSQSITTP